MDSEAKHTPITHDEARKIAQRLINGSFRRDGEQLEYDKRPRFSIPANPDRDDDLRICDYIEQQKAALAERDAALVAVEALKARVAELEQDRARLDFLDRTNNRLNAAYGTRYRWQLIMNHNVNRLASGHLVIDLHDMAPNGVPSCRTAIDEKMREVEALSSLPTEQVKK